MNNNTRKQIRRIIKDLQSGKETCSDMVLSFQEILDEEQEKLDNLSGTPLEESQMANDIQEAIDHLEQAISSLEDNELEEAVEELEQI